VTLYLQQFTSRIKQH